MGYIFVYNPLLRFDAVWPAHTRECPVLPNVSTAAFVQSKWQGKSMPMLSVAPCRTFEAASQAGLDVIRLLSSASSAVARSHPMCRNPMKSCTMASYDQSHATASCMKQADSPCTAAITHVGVYSPRTLQSQAIAQHVPACTVAWQFHEGGSFRLRPSKARPPTSESVSPEGHK